MAIVSQKVRGSARNEECTLQIVGVCNYQPETVILAHLPDETKGMGKKADDISSCYACAACHDAIDGRNRSPEFDGRRDWYMRRAMVRTWRRLIDKGLVVIR